MTTIADKLAAERELSAEQARRYAVSADRRLKLFNRTCVAVLIAFALVWLVPLAWAVDTSLKPNGETTNPTWKIMEPTLASYRTLLDQGDILNWYAASIITSTLSALGTVTAGWHVAS
jgi:multiple sugar transport system permease protein